MNTTLHQNINIEEKAQYLKKKKKMAHACYLRIKACSKNEMVASDFAICSITEVVDIEGVVKVALFNVYSSTFV